MQPLSRHVRGFTLVELVVSLIVVGILAASMWPRAPSTESITLNGRAEQLAADLRYAQTLSMTTGARNCLIFTPVSGPPYSGYELRNDATPCGTVVSHPAFGLTQPISLCSTGTCINVAPALTNDYVQFDGLGVPYSAPASALGANTVITLSDSGGSRTVTISPTTGRVIVQ